MDLETSYLEYSYSNKFDTLSSFSICCITYRRDGSFRSLRLLPPSELDTVLISHLYPSIVNLINSNVLILVTIREVHKYPLDSVTLTCHIYLYFLIRTLRFLLEQIK